MSFQINSDSLGLWGFCVSPGRALGFYLCICVCFSVFLGFFLPSVTTPRRLRRLRRYEDEKGRKKKCRCMGRNFR